MTAAHGDVRRYWTGCRCDDCGSAGSDYNAAYEHLLRRNGRHRYQPIVPADGATAAVRWLIDAGATREWIAERSGVGRQTVIRLAQGHHNRVRTRTSGLLQALARAVGSGEIQPPGYADARRRQLARQARREQRQGVSA